MNTAILPSVPRRRQAGFTMMEIAISLAIIGIALVAIVGVLPYGLHAQRDNREETIIAQDASVLLDAIRSGAHGMDDLTNYVICITNIQTFYKPDGTPNLPPNTYGYSYAAVTQNGSVAANLSMMALTNGANIVGVLSTPEYVDNEFLPIPNLLNGGYSNHVVAYFRSLSGPVAEKPPQDNSILRGDSFGYRVICVNAPIARTYNIAPNSYDSQIGYNQRELRLTFTWPLLPSQPGYGTIGASPNGSVTFRTTIPGQVVADAAAVGWRYFYRSQLFVVANTNIP